MSARLTLPKCRHCRAAIIVCGARPSHGGCSSARGWLHSVSGRHSCGKGDPRNCAGPAGAVVPAEDPEGSGT